MLLQLTSIWVLGRKPNEIHEAYSEAHRRVRHNLTKPTRSCRYPKVVNCWNLSGKFKRWEMRVKVLFVSPSGFYNLYILAPSQNKACKEKFHLNSFWFTLVKCVLILTVNFYLDQFFKLLNVSFLVAGKPIYYSVASWWDLNFFRKVSFLTLPNTCIAYPLSLIAYWKVINITFQQSKLLSKVINWRRSQSLVIFSEMK